MRHILLSDAVTLSALRVRKAPAPARLVAPAGLAHALTPGRARATLGTINLPAIIVTANQYLRTAQCAHKNPSRRFHWRP
jgi:adenosylcobinamide amidohydrolase